MVLGGPGPDLWPLKIGHKFYHEFLMQIVPQFVLLLWQLLLIPPAKAGVVLKNSGNLLHDSHKNFENQFRNSWDIWSQSFHLQHRNYFYASVPLTGANFNLSYVKYFWIDFQNSWAYHVANFLNFSKLPQLFQSGWVEAIKITKTNCGTTSIKNS